MGEVVGAVIESGVQDWQIVQQDAAGCATLRVAGRWATTIAHSRAAVVVRLVREDSGAAVTRRLDWQAAETRADGTWGGTLSAVPRGGLYRLETALQLDGGAIEWAQRGDVAHHLGVGDVWVIAGQSNAAGYGRNPIMDGPELGVHAFLARGRWALAAHPLSDSTDTRYPANQEIANGAHSPFLQFGRVLKRELGYPIGLIPTALGGSPIRRWLRSRNGDLFANMLDYVRDAGGACRGMLWYQGESDTDDKLAAQYLENFKELVAEARAALGRADLPVITAQLNAYTAPPKTHPAVGGGWDVIREAQRQAALQIPGVYVISTVGLGLSDAIHNGSDANLVIGERMASVVLGGVFGRDVKYLHPDAESARATGPQDVTLTFRNVDTRLDLGNTIEKEIPFAVRDDAGDVALTAWAIVAPNQLVLKLARALQGEATVVGAPTWCPPRQVPLDICGYRTMLGFTVGVTGRKSQIAGQE